MVKRPAGIKGFLLLPKCWIVERTFTGLGRDRRLSKDDELLTQTSETMSRVAMIHLTGRRLSRLACF
jgi:putative transposase